MTVFLRLAWRNIWRQPRRTLLTIGAIVFANTVLVFMISLQFGMYGLMIDNTLAVSTGHLQVQAPGYKDARKMRQSIPDIAALAASIRDAAGFAGVAARGAAFALASSAERSFGVQVIGVEPEHEARVSNLPGLLRAGRYPAGRDAVEVVIGSVLARNLHVTIGDELTLLGSGRDGSFAAAVLEVTGIFASGMPDIDRSVVQIPLGTFQHIFSMGSAGHQIVVRLNDIAGVSAARQHLESLLPDDGNLRVLDWNELQPSLKQAIQAELAGAWFMYGVLIVLVAFSVLNTVLMSVLERTREFGIVIALGFAPGSLGRLILLETALLSAIGFAGGILLGAALILWFGAHGFSYPGMDAMAERFNMPKRIYPTIRLLPLLLGPCIVFVAALLASLYPAARLHWLQPVPAMRAA